MFTLDQLQSFVVVAEEMHFGRAADRLNMTQPPLSRQIQKLEREVGALLLNRDSRSVSLTPAGSAFLIEARRLLSLAESAPDLARRISAGATGLVRIAFTAGSTFEVLGDLLNAIARHLGGISVELSEMVSAEQVGALERGEIDLGLHRPPIDDTVHQSLLIQREQLVVAAPKGHALTKLKRPITPVDLENEPMIIQSPIKARYFYDLVVRSAPLSNKRASHAASEIITLVALVAAGRGVALVPESTRRMKYRGITYLDFETDHHDAVELYAVWSRTSVNPALGRVVALLRRSFAVDKD